MIVIVGLMAMAMALGKMQFDTRTWVNWPWKSRRLRMRKPKAVGSAVIVGAGASRISLVTGMPVSATMARNWRP